MLGYYVLQSVFAGKKRKLHKLTFSSKIMPMDLGCHVCFCLPHWFMYILVVTDVVVGKFHTCEKRDRIIIWVDSSWFRNKLKCMCKI